MQTTSLKLPQIATECPTLEQAQATGKGLGDTLRAAEDVGQSIRAYAQHIASLAKFPNGPELISEILYCADVRLFTGKGKKSESPVSYAMWRQLRNGITAQGREMGLDIKVTSPKGVYQTQVTKRTKGSQTGSKAKRTNVVDQMHAIIQHLPLEQQTAHVWALLAKVQTADHGAPTRQTERALAAAKRKVAKVEAKRKAS